MIATDKLKQEVQKRTDEITEYGYHQTILNIMYQHWQILENNNMSYDEIIQWFENEYGELAKFAVMIGKFNQQVTNGGHFQYYHNGYAGDIDEYNSDIPLHNQLVVLMSKTKLKDEISLQAFKIIEELYIELDTEQYIEEEIVNDDGDLEIDEYDNPDYMEVSNTDMLNQFDLAYYKVNDEFMEILEQYFKTKIENIDTTWDYKDDYYYTQIGDIEINLRVYPDDTISIWIYNHSTDTELLDNEYKNIDDIKLYLYKLFN